MSPKPTSPRVSHRSLRLSRPFFSSSARGWARRAVLLATASGIALGTHASPAAAGDYRVYACSAPDGSYAPLDGWRSTNSLSYSGAFNDCASGGGFGAYMGTEEIGRNHWWSLNQSAEWKFATPQFKPGSHLVHMTVRRGVGIGFAAGTDTGNAHPFYWVRDGHGTIHESCGLLGGCLGLGSPNHAGASGNGASYGFAEPADVSFVTGCGGTSGGCAPAPVGAARSIFRIFGVTSTLRDTEKPERVVAATGGLLRDEALRGNQSMQFDVKDYQSGIYEVVVTVGGRVIDRHVPDANGGKCVDAGADPNDRYEFRHVLPCSSSAAVDRSVDTRLAPEGKHELHVYVTDASGNTTTVFRGSAVIDNVPPPSLVEPPRLESEPAGGLRPGDSLGATAGRWAGPEVKLEYRWQHGDGASWADIPRATASSYVVTRADVGKRVRAVVTARNSEGSAEAGTGATAVVQTGASIVPQTIQPGPGDGSPNGAGGDTSSAQMVVDREQRSVEVKYGTKIVVTGRLVDGEGRPIADAEVDVYEQIVTSAAPWAKLATVKTDSQGGYSLRPKTTASRRLRFAYAAQRGAADYRATRDVLVAVSAGMTARAVRRVLKPGGVIRLRGRVTLEGLPKAGTWVEVQVFDAGTWRTVGSRRASSRGLWTFKHRLRRSAGVKFQFRALLRTAGDVPSAEAKSPSVKVRVR